MGNSSPHRKDVEESVINGELTLNFWSYEVTSAISQLQF